MLLIDDRVRDLVGRIDDGVSNVDTEMRELVAHLRDRCNLPEIKARYDAYQGESGDMTAYPFDSEGYAQSFDALCQEEEFIACWSRFGVVVGRAVVPADVCKYAIERIHELMLDVSGATCDLSKPHTWDAIPLDSSGVPIISRGFFEVYHDNCLAQLRQAVRLYIHHVLIWGRADLWTTFDRLGVKLPNHGDSRGLPLHVDQNPLRQQGFQTLQGVLALSGCPAERGTFVGVPGSKQLFDNYGRMSMAERSREYVELDLADPIADTLQGHAQLFPLRAGDLVSWDSRTTHANSPNISNAPRLVAYVAAGPARESDSDAVKARAEAFGSGIGANVRPALMHASKKPRYLNPDAIALARVPEHLSLLGGLLYGQRSYATV